MSLSGGGDKTPACTKHSIKEDKKWNQRQTGGASGPRLLQATRSGAHFLFRRCFMLLMWDVRWELQNNTQCHWYTWKLLIWSWSLFCFLRTFCSFYRMELLHDVFALHQDDSVLPLAHLFSIEVHIRPVGNICGGLAALLLSSLLPHKLRNISRELLQIWCKCSLWLNNVIWCSEVKGHSKPWLWQWNISITALDGLWEWWFWP